jgi:hypothetical protein
VVGVVGVVVAGGIVGEIVMVVVMVVVIVVVIVAVIVVVVVVVVVGIVVGLVKPYWMEITSVERRIEIIAVKKGEQKGNWQNLVSLFTHKC